MLTVTLVNSAIYDAAGISVSLQQSNNTTNLFDQTRPAISLISMVSDSTVEVTFSVPVFSTNGGSGALDSADFTLFY